MKKVVALNGHENAVGHALSKQWLGRSMYFELLRQNPNRLRCRSVEDESKDPSSVDKWVTAPITLCETSENVVNSTNANYRQDDPMQNIITDSCTTISDLKRPHDFNSGYATNSVSALSLGEGWFVALSVIVAAKMGSVSNRNARLDIRLLSRQREERRSLSLDLRRRRALWLSQEKKMLDMVEQERIEKMQRRAKEEAEQAAEENKRYQRIAKQESERLAAEREAARQEYEAKQKAIEAEYQERVKREKQILDEARRIKQEEEESRRRAEEERKRLEAENQRIFEEEEKRKNEEKQRAKREEMKRLEYEKQKFAVRTEGKALAQRPPFGTKILFGPISKEARIRLALETGSLLGGASPRIQHDFINSEDALMAAAGIAGQQARRTSDSLQSALTLQAMAGEGPMCQLDKLQQKYWMALTTARTSILALSALEHSLDNLQAASLEAYESEMFQVRTEIRILSESHPNSSQSIFHQALCLIQAQEDFNEVRSTLIDSIETENNLFYDGILPFLPKSMKDCPKCLGSLIFLSYFVDFALDRIPEDKTETVWIDMIMSFVQFEISKIFANAPPDSLEAASIIIVASVGEEHLVSSKIRSFAESNISNKERNRREEIERVRTAEIAAKLVEEAWPDDDAIRAARVADKEAKTPLAEKLWALRNVAGTLAMGNSGERARARKLLEEAFILKKEAAGTSYHPSLLPELADLCDLLIVDQDWKSDAAGVASLILKILEDIAVAYAESGDPVSGTILLEAGLRKYEEISGIKSKAVKSATRFADKLLSSMSEKDIDSVKAARSSTGSKIIGNVVNALTDTLGAYRDTMSIQKTKIEEWDEVGIAMLGSISSWF